MEEEEDEKKEEQGCLSTELALNTLLPWPALGFSQEKKIGQGDIKVSPWKLLERKAAELSPLLSSFLFASVQIPWV